MLKQLNIGEMHYHLRPAGVRAEIENTIDALTQELDVKQLNIFVLSDYENIFTINDLRIKTRFKKGKKVKISRVNISELNYNTKPAKNKKQFLKEADELKERTLKNIPIEKCSKENPFVLHAHGLPLGKNPRLSAAIRMLAEECFMQKKPLWILNQIHDFAENSRPEMLQTLQNCTGKFDAKFASKIMYPNTPNVFYATINSRDSENLLMMGIDPGRIFYLPNSVDIKFYATPPITKRKKYKKQLMEKINEYANKNDFFFDENRKIILSPLKLMRRKNNIESLLLLMVFNYLDDKFQLLITLEAHSGKDVEYANKFKEFIKENRLPVVVGLGQELVSNFEGRQFENGKIVEFNLVDIFAVSEAILTTSILEGFGFSFIEGWLTGKAIIGRKLPYVCKDFEKIGLKLKHMYKKIWVPMDWIKNCKKRLVQIYLENVDTLIKNQGMKIFSRKMIERKIAELKCRRIGKYICIDFKELDLYMQFEAIENIFSEEKNIKEFLKINPIIRSIFNLVEKKPKQLIEHNKKVIKKKYSLKAKANHLKKIILIGNSFYLKTIKTKPTDNKKVIAKYLDLDYIHPLTVE